MSGKAIKYKITLFYTHKLLDLMGRDKNKNICLLCWKENLKKAIVIQEIKKEVIYPPEYKGYEGEYEVTKFRVTLQFNENLKRKYFCSKNCAKSKFEKESKFPVGKFFTLR